MISSSIPATSNKTCILNISRDPSSHVTDMSRKFIRKPWEAGAIPELHFRLTPESHPKDDY